MKKAVKSISENYEFVMPFFFAAVLITLISYNIIVHGITNTTAFEF